MIAGLGRCPHHKTPIPMSKRYYDYDAAVCGHGQVVATASTTGQMPHSHKACQSTVPARPLPPVLLSSKLHGWATARVMYLTDLMRCRQHRAQGSIGWP